MIETDYIKEGDKLLRDVKKIPALSEFSDDYLRLFLKMSKIRKYDKREIVCYEGLSDNWIYFLLQGEVQVEKKGNKLATMNKRGEMFGEMGLIDGAPRSANITAKKATMCIATDIDMLNNLHGIEKATFGFILSRAVAFNLAERLKKANELFVNAPEKISLKSLKKKFF